MQVRAFFKKLKYAMFILLLIGGSWAVQRWTFEEEIIRIDGKAVQVIDGDSFKVGDAEYRIYGIDAPEYLQKCKDEKGVEWRCGSHARSGLKETLGQQDFACNVRAKDRFGRMIVICLTDKKIDLGSTLVEQGYAVSGVNFSETIYAVDEKVAKTAKRGIWKGEFVRPDIWRGENPRK